jgi:hypothetical protein
VVRLEEKTLPVVVLGALWAFILCSSSLACCSPDSWLDGASLFPPAGSYSKLELRQHFLFLGTLCEGGRPRTTYIGEIAYSWRRHGPTFGSCGTASGRFEPCTPQP